MGIRKKGERCGLELVVEVVEDDVGEEWSEGWWLGSWVVSWVEEGVVYERGGKIFVYKGEKGGMVDGWG